MNSPAIASDDLNHCEIPYDTLYIYYFKGRLKRIDIDLGADYIGNWEEEDTSFLFFSKPAPPFLNRLLETNPQLELLDQYQMSYQDWHGEAIRPIRTEQLLIVPPWTTEREGLNPSGSLGEIVLDPGVVFGTGFHPTTRDCLLALEHLFAIQHPMTVLDLGTGTGLLAIAAIRLGSPQGLAVEINHLAAKTALRNVHLNRLFDQLLIIQGRAEDFLFNGVELLMANIHFDIMQRLIQSEGFLSKNWFILSGLMRSEAREVERMIAPKPLTVIKRWTHDDIWHTFLIRKIPS